jgi:hypothetical protein
MDARQFLDDIIAARGIRVLPITAEIAVLSQSGHVCPRRSGGSVDRGPPPCCNGRPLITSDAALRKLKGVTTIW